MNPLAHPGAPADFSIHPATLMGPVSLAVASLAQQIQFYQTALGFQLHWRTAQQAGLGAESGRFAIGGSSGINAG